MEGVDLIVCCEASGTGAERQRGDLSRGRKGWSGGGFHSWPVLMVRLVLAPCPEGSFLVVPGLYGVGWWAWGKAQQR